MNPQTIFTLIGLIVPIFIAIGGRNLAIKKNRNSTLWFIICLFTGLLGLLVIACSRTLDYNEELDFTEESDVLGWIMLPISIIWLILTFYNSYYAVKSYHDAMIFDAMMQFMR